MTIATGEITTVDGARDICETFDITPLEAVRALPAQHRDDALAGAQRSARENDEPVPDTLEDAPAAVLAEWCDHWFDHADYVEYVLGTRDEVYVDFYRGARVHTIIALPNVEVAGDE